MTMFLVLILFICFIFIMIVFNLLKSPKLFPRVKSFNGMPASLESEIYPSVYKAYEEIERRDDLELELQNNLRLLEYLMTMEFNVNNSTFKSIEEVKRFKDYQKLKGDVEKRILNIVNVKETSIDS